MNTVERFDVHEFGATVEMVMASAFDAQADEIKRLKNQVIKLQLEISDMHLEAHADTVLIQRAIAENTHLRSDIDVIGNVLSASINYAASYLDAHKMFRAHIKRLAEEYDEHEDASIALGNLRDALSDAVKRDHF